MKTIHQVIYDVRQQPLVSWISIGGTALAIFLIMVIYMVNGLGSVEAAPELKRTRIFYGSGIDMRKEGGGGSAALSQEYARRLYGNLDGVETVAYTSAWLDTRDAQSGAGEAVESMVMQTDRAFWDVYDFRFSEGTPYDDEDCKAGARRAVITSGLAERLFGKGEEIEGKEIMLDLVPYTVTGVVDNANPLMGQTYADIYIPLVPETGSDFMGGEYPWFGNTKAHILARPGVKVESLREQVRARYKVISAEASRTTGGEIIYHEQPYDSAVMAEGNFGTNTTPDMEGSRTREWLSYLVLLLLPAINLSTMTRARMRRRVSEIGVRRAFGARRTQIVGQLLMENLLLTLIGGVAGLILSLIFAMNFSQYVVITVNAWYASFAQLTSAPGFDMLFKWHTFFIALVFCAVLNLISAGIPAIKAARVNPAEALGGQGK